MIIILEETPNYIKVKKGETEYKIGEGQIYRKEMFIPVGELIKIKKLQLNSNREDFHLIVDVMNDGKTTFRNVSMDLEMVLVKYKLLKEEIEITPNEINRLDTIE